ncbi:MAG TPA: YigZ family protein [Cytophagaceae bacterium]
MTERNDSYLSIKSPSEGLYKEKGSKFLAFAYPVESEEEIKEILNDLKKKYYDARHHCYAFILGPEKSIYRASDAGEPAHSAGDPILNQIRSSGVTNVLVVVVRYFGGTKLGVSGLINAYKTAAADALANATVIEKLVTEKIRVHFDYPQTNEIMKALKETQAEFIHQDFSANCTILFSVRKNLKDIVVDKLEKAGGVIHFE